MHFTVLVIGDNVEEKLEPYYELQCTMNQYDMKNDSRAEFIEEYTTEELKKDFIKIKNEHPEYYYKNLEEFADDYHGIHQLNNSWGRYTNPKSEWDWYQVGGRWSGIFKVKDNPKYPDDIYTGQPGLMSEKAKNGYVDSIRFCDIDFNGMKIDKEIDLNNNWIKIEEGIKNDDNSIYWKYNIQKGETKEQYIKNNIMFRTYAVLKDDVWYDSDKFDNYNEIFNDTLKSLPEDTLLTIVDCHV